MEYFSFGDSRQDINVADAFAIRSPENINLDLRYKTLMKQKECGNHIYYMQTKQATLLFSCSNDIE